MRVNLRKLQKDSKAKQVIAQHTELVLKGENLGSSSFELDVVVVEIVMEHLQAEKFDLNWSKIFTHALADVAVKFPSSLHDAENICKIAKNKKISLLLNDPYLISAWHLSTQRAALDSKFLKPLLKFLAKNKIVIDYQDKKIIEACKNGLKKFDSEYEGNPISFNEQKQKGLLLAEYTKMGIAEQDLT